MGASPGGAEIGAGAGVATQVAKVAVKIAKEALKGVAEVAKTPGKMATFARRGLSHRKIEGSSTVMPDLAKSAGGSQAPESPVQETVAETTTTAQAAPDVLATAAQDTDKAVSLPPADAKKVDELTDKAREMADANRAKSEGSATQAVDSGSAEPVKPEVATPAENAARPEGPASRVPKNLANDEKFRMILAQTMKDAHDKGEKIDLPTVRERALKTYYSGRVRHPSLRERLSILSARLNDKGLRDKINERRIEAKAANKNREAYDLKSAIEDTIARWKHMQDLHEEDHPEEKKENILALLIKAVLGVVVGSVVTAGKQGAEPSLNPRT